MRMRFESAISKRRRSSGESISAPNASPSKVAEGNVAFSRVTELIGNSGRLQGFYDDETDSEGDLDLLNPTEVGAPAAAAGVNDGGMSELVKSGALSGKDAIFLRLAEKMLTFLDGVSLNVGGSPSDTLAIDPSDPFGNYGLKAVMDLHRLADKIKFRPAGIYNGLYSEATEEMWVEKGEPLNMDKHRRSVNFRKYQSLNRCAAMMVSLLRLFRRGQVEQAHAQCAQCYRALLQAGLDEGDWSNDWHLTGLKDPVTKKESGCPPSQMAVIAKYPKAMAELRKNPSDNAPSWATPEYAAEDKKGDWGKDKGRKGHGKGKET